jgi:uncharacterized membrane protein
MQLQPQQQFRQQTNRAFEVFIAALTVLPIAVLIYFYSQLPERVPEYLNLRGEVVVWGRKGFSTVFRLPLMALDLQVLCLLTKYGICQSRSATPVAADERLAALREESFTTSARLFDLLRAFVAIKLAASSLEIIFYSVERFYFLTTFTRVTSWTASILGVGGALYYSYRFLRLNREINRELAGAKAPEKTNQAESHSRFFYYNPADPAWFTNNYRPNFGNKWLYIFMACLLCLPALMFWPMLSS